MIRTHIILVNRNTLKYTKQILLDLLEQTVPFSISLIDNGSDDQTKMVKLFHHFSNIYKEKGCITKLVANAFNMDLNKIWSIESLTTSLDFVCFLNNDMRIPKNFVESSERLFDAESHIGITCHATNTPKYTEAMNLLRYKEVEGVYQGWDMTIRKSLIKPIPPEMTLYGGDIHYWQLVYEAGLKGAVITSSPIIHYQGQTGTRHERQRTHKIINPMKLKRLLAVYQDYAKVRPDEIRGIYDIDGTWMEVPKDLQWLGAARAAPNK